MSNIFEAVAVPPGEVEQVPPGYLSVVTPVALVFLRQASRDVALDEVELRLLAERLSVARGVAVALMYDDRIGQRSSHVYRAGSLSAFYGPHTERWSLLGKDGLAISDGAGYLEAELAPEDEAECIISALQQGLESLGLGASQARALVRQLVGVG